MYDVPYKKPLLLNLDIDGVSVEIDNDSYILPSEYSDGVIGMPAISRYKKIGFNFKDMILSVN
jgi:hypothetical protein